MTGLGFVPALPRVTRPRGPWGWGSGMLIQCGLFGQFLLVADADADADGDGGRGCRDFVRGCHSCTGYLTLTPRG